MEVAKYNDKMDPISDISPDGDVVLVVGPQSTRLRVQSQCLRCASKVFDAMFGPHWSEGQGLSKQSPRDVPLIESDADALRTICCVIHHRNNDVPQSLTPKEILHIAIEADKYDLNVALKFAFIQWMKPRDNVGRVEKGYLLATGFLSGDMDMFVEHSMMLMLHHKGSYLDFFNDEITNRIVPLKTFYLLEERRTRMRADLLDLLRRARDASCSCGWGKELSEKYTSVLSRYGPLEMLDLPISDLIRRIENLSFDDMARSYCSKANGRYHESVNYREYFLGHLEAMKKRASICLDCVRDGDDKTPCRFKHV